MEPNETTSAASGGDDSPKKYIRTFAGDMQTFQSGGAPDLTPLEGSKSSPSERLIEASSLPVVSQPVPAPAPLPPVLEQKLAPPLEEEKPTPLKTYSGDFSDRMHETHASRATVLAAEQDAAAAPSSPAEEVQEERPHRNYWLIGGGIFLLVAGSAGGYFVYSRYASMLTPVIVAPGVSTPIFVDSHGQVSGSGSALTVAIRQSASDPLLINTVRALTLADAPDGVTVFSALSVHAPDILLRNIDAAGSMAGIVNTNSGQAPFFILSVGSYRATFSGMLSWERTMLTDLGPFFPMYPAGAGSTASSTAAAATTTVAAKAGFRDEVVSNHDVRVYRDALNRSIMLYGYWDQKTLVIARDPAAFTEILARLATSHGR